MMQFTDLTGLMSSAIAVTALGMMLIPARTSTRQRRWISGSLFIALLVPWNGEPLAIHPRGIFGDLSITSIILLLLSVANRVGVPIARHGVLHKLMESRLALLGIITLLALLLYPMALGIGMFDPYRLGYAPLTLIVMLSVVAALALWTHRYLVAVVIVFSILAWSIGWYESTNLWDYLLDPIVSVYAIVALVKRGMVRLFQQKTLQSKHTGN